MPNDTPLFRLSLAQWSLHRMMRGEQLLPLDFPGFVREHFDLDAVEYVNVFFRDRESDPAYLDELKGRCDDAGITSLLIMIDREGDMGHPDDAERAQAVENHHKWVHAAKHLGCHSIRVNAKTDPEQTFEEQQKLAADGLRRLTEYAAQHDIDVLVENHGGLSSNGQWLSGVMRLVDHPRCGTLPDFGNFCFDWSRQDEPDQWYDRYRGVAEMMPFAKAVSAKSNEFDADGNDTRSDYERLLKIVLDAGYRGWIGVEYEGEDPDEIAGVKKTIALLERTRERLISQVTA